MIPQTVTVLPTSESLQHWIERGAIEYNGAPIPHYPTENAPNSYKDLKAWSDNHVIGKDPLPVFSGGCSSTIFESEKANYLFRSWHDAIHINEGLSFTVSDEVKVSDIHCSVLTYLKAPYNVVKAIEADVKGQVYYHSITGQYVNNQKLFVSKCLKYGINTVIDSVKNGVKF